jgi:hypothetical protein
MTVDPRTITVENRPPCVVCQFNGTSSFLTTESDALAAYFELQF